MPTYINSINSEVVQQGSTTLCNHFTRYSTTWLAYVVLRCFLGKSSSSKTFTLHVVRRGFQGPTTSFTRSSRRSPAKFQPTFLTGSAVTSALI